MNLAERIRRDGKAMMLLNTYWPARSWLRPHCWSCGAELYTVRQVALHKRTDCIAGREVPQSRADYDDWVARGQPKDAHGNWVRP